MKTITKVIMLLLAFSLSNGVMAQSFLKKLSKAAEDVANAVTTTETAANAEAEPASNDSINVKALLAENISFTAMKVYVIDEATGDTVKNDDGTYKIRYSIIDAKGNVCSPEKAKEIVANRTKEVTKILGNVGKGALVGGAAALLSGGNKKDALKGAATGALTGLVLSSEEISKVQQLSKELKAYKKTIDAYEKTFNEEGDMIDASVDLSDVDGIDFTNIGSMAKTSKDIMNDLENADDAGSLDDIEI